jgi:copper homeostasis protein (lipoprotein)
MRLASLLIVLAAPVLAQEPAPNAAPAGQLLVGFYVGTLPCADCPGIRTELSLFSLPAGTSGSFWLKETYLGKPEKDATFESGGSWVIEASRDDPKATVYRLTEARSRTDRFLLKVRDGELRMLDRSGRAIDSKQEYLLKRRDKPSA